MPPTCGLTSPPETTRSPGKDVVDFAGAQLIITTSRTGARACPSSQVANSIKDNNIQNGPRQGSG